MNLVRIFLIGICVTAQNIPIKAETQVPTGVELGRIDTQVLIPTPQEKPVIAPVKKREKYITFNFTDADLTTIANLIAAKKGINIVLPQGVAAITQKVTIKFPKKISLSEAEKYFLYILDLAGYGMYPIENYYVIKKLETGITREPLPLYINVPVKNCLFQNVSGLFII